MSAMDISEVARRSGVPASTLRYYEEKKLIESIGRRGLRRLFEPNVLERLGLIAVGRAAGFSLDEMAAMFELDVMVRRLAAMRDGLRHAAACPAPSHMECPKFRRIVRRAIVGPRRRRALVGAPRS